MNNSPMTFEDYADVAWKTAIYPNKGDNLTYTILGLAGESGECCECLKKMMRDDGGHLSQARRATMIKELGDVAWYLNAVCHELKIPLAEVLAINLEKLQSRRDRGVLQGSGDNR